MSIKTLDHWTWNTASGMVPQFAREERRFAYLRAKQTRTPAEDLELDRGALPWAYLGATYFGQTVKVTLLMDGTDDRPAYLRNDPNRWITLSPGLSTHNWPYGPPGWVTLIPDEDYSTDEPQRSAMAMRIPAPWDVILQRQLNEGPLLSGER